MMLPPAPDNNYGDSEQPSSMLPPEEASSIHPEPPRFRPLDNVSDEETSDEDRKKIQESRTNFAILHFAFTVPKYSLSLFLFLAASCIPMHTPQEAIHKPISNLKTLVKMETQSYSTCVKEAFDHVLSSELEELAQTEYTRAMDAQTNNRKRIQLATEMGRDCSVATNMAKRSLQTWNAVNGQLEIFANQTCSPADQAILDAFLGNASSLLVQDEITSQIEEYTWKSTHSMQLVQKYAQDRMQYDYDYFVTNRIQPTLTLIQNGLNVSLANLTLWMDPEDLSVRIQDSLKDLETILNAAKAQMENLSIRLQDYRQSIEEFFRHYQDIYNRLKEGADFVIEFLPTGLEIPSLFKMESLPRANSLLPQFYHYPLDDFALSTQQVLDQTKAKFIELLQEMYSEAERQAKHHLRGHADDLLDTISSSLSLEGYDPPRFQGSQDGTTLEEELQYLQSLGNQVHQTTADALGPLKQLYRQQVASSNFPNNFTTGNWNNQSSTLASDVLPTTTFDYLKPIFPNISIPEFLKMAFSWVLSNAWVVETIVQAIRLWVLEAKYAKGAIPDLPVLDYEEEFLSRTFDNDDSRSLALLFKTLVSAFASPLYWLALVLIPLTLGILVIWRPHVQQSCLDSRNGTYLANHFFAPLIINGANAPGHALYLQGETECHTAKQSICNDLYVEFEAALDSDAATVSALEIHRNDSAQTIHALKSCIDLSVNVESMNAACCGLKGYGTQGCNSTSLICPIDEVAPQGEAASFRPVTEYIRDPFCLVDNFPLTLDNSRFNCSALTNKCFDIPCTDVNQDHLLAKTIETDCQVELYVLDCCSFVIMVVYQVFAVSLICTMSFQGIRQLFWKKLCPDGVRFHTQLCENGDIAFGDSKMDRFERMSMAIERYERNGKFKLIFGFLALIWWSISLVIFRYYELF